MEQESTAPKGSKINKTKDALTVASMTVTILGALGTVFVTVAANFYVGELEVVPNKPYQDIEVEVFDKKGQLSTFPTTTMQLMPGKYHLAVSIDGKPKQHMDAEIKLREKTRIEVAVPEQTAAAPADLSLTKKSHHKWWQIWKSDSAKESAETSQTGRAQNGAAASGLSESATPQTEALPVRTDQQASSVQPLSETIK